MGGERERERTGRFETYCTSLSIIYLVQIIDVRRGEHFVNNSAQGYIKRSYYEP